MVKDSVAEARQEAAELARIGLYAYEDPSNFWNDPKREEMLARLRAALTDTPTDTEQRAESDDAAQSEGK